MFWNLKYRIGIGSSILLILLLSPLGHVWAEEIIQKRTVDGIIFKVHYGKTSDIKEQAYAYQVLACACQAYKEIVFRQGFCRQGYTFARSNRLFAYDSDRTIDIYVANNVKGPCALMQPEGGLAYQAKIFIPANYREYRQRYNINQPSSELKASLTHELLHIITYSYNRNMQLISQGKSSLTSQHWDWYTEGLARYFEALVGYRDEFLSAGYRKINGNVITIYKGGVNYFLHYPDKPLEERKYDFALFWQYLHKNYGMSKIEEISFRFREIDPCLCSNRQAMQLIAKTLKVDLNELLRDFSLYVYNASSVAEQKEQGLRKVYVTKILSGHNTTVSDRICSFGFDYYQFEMRKNIKSLKIEVAKDINFLVGVFSQGRLEILGQGCGKERIDLTQLPEKKKVILMFSNPQDQTVSYHFRLN